MVKKIFALTFIFICSSIAWMILGTITTIRTHNYEGTLKKKVGELWGTEQIQTAPLLYYEKEVTQTVTSRENKEETKVVTTITPAAIEGSNIYVKIKLDQRRKGLLWYSLYHAEFSGEYIRKEKFYSKIQIPSQKRYLRQFCFKNRRQTL